MFCNPPPCVGVRVGFATPELTVGESSQLLNITVQLTEGRLAVGVVVTIDAVGGLAGTLSTNISTIVVWLHGYWCTCLLIEYAYLVASA